MKTPPRSPKRLYASSRRMGSPRCARGRRPSTSSPTTKARQWTKWSPQSANSRACDKNQSIHSVPEARCEKRNRDEILLGNPAKYQ